MRFLIPLLPCLSLMLMGCPKSAPPPPPEQLSFQRGLVALEKGEREVAAASFETSLRINRSFPPAYWMLSQLAVDSNQLDRAIQLLQTLHQVAPSEPRVLSRLAELQNMAGRFLQAAPLAQEAVRRDPKDALAQVQLAQFYEGTGQLPEAIIALTKAHELEPLSEMAPLALTRLLAQTGARTEAWKVLEAMPQEPKLKAQYHYMKGWLLSEYGRIKPDPTAALIELNTALAVRPEYPAALQQKAHVLLQLKKPTEAGELIEKAGKLGGMTTALLKDLALLQASKGDPKAPLLHQQAALRRQEEKEHALLRRRYLMSPGDAQSTLKLARKEATLGSLDEAQRLVLEVLKKDPNNTTALDMVERFMVRAKPK
nr:tetratricopeptide repeat protein [Armatimonas sp.]